MCKRFTKQFWIDLAVGIALLIGILLTSSELKAIAHGSVYQFHVRVFVWHD